MNPATSPRRRSSAPILAACIILTASPILQAADPVQPVNVADLLLQPSPFKDRQDEQRDNVIAGLDPNRLLYWYRDNAGLSQPAGITSSIGGWDDGFVRGHYAGHYLSAASRYAAEGDAAYLAKVNDMVASMAQIQTALGGGYLSGFSSQVFDQFELTPHQYHTINGVSYGVPYYTIDKIFGGLNDAYFYTGNNQALDITEHMADYFAGRFAALTPAQIDEIVYTNGPSGTANEYGAMSKALTDVYVYAKARGDANPERFLATANIFNNPHFVTPLAAGQDVLTNIHANTHIAQIVGVARYANITGDPLTSAASANFWDIVLRSHTFCNGGNSFGEAFRSPGVETAGTGSSALTNSVSETCNTYNMIRLSELLFERNQDPKYAAYVESALYNQILGANNPATGMMSYYNPLAPGTTRSYGTIYNTNWCCEGTGIDSAASYGDKVYFKNADTLWVNVYMPTQVHWAEKGLTLLQQGEVLKNDTVNFTAALDAPTHAELKFRIPSWTFGNVTLSVNGVSQPVDAVRGTFLSLDRDWTSGDTVQLTMPKKLYIRRSTDDPTMVSIYYGPVLLAGAWGASQSVAPIIDTASADPSTWLTLTDPSTMTFSVKNLNSAVDLQFKPSYAIQGNSTRLSMYVKLTAPVATRTWRGGGMLNTFNDGTNWDVAAGSGDTLAFDGNLTTTADNNFIANTSFAAITFKPTAASFNLIGNQLQLTGDITNNSPNPQTISLPINLASGNHSVQSTAADLTIAGDLTGPGNLLKTGPCTLTLTGNNTGNITISGGQLRIGDGGATGALGAAQVTLANNAELAFDRAGSLTVAAPITGQGNLSKTGPGLLTLQAPATYTGNTTIAHGTLQLGSFSLAGNITHRWSFNNNLLDSVGSSNASIVDVGTLNTSLGATAITLTGGARTAADFVRLGSNLLPKDNSSPVTIELWATQRSIQNWSRIIDLGSSSTENLLMSWTRGTTLTNDRVEWRDAITTTVDDSNQPYNLNTEYHIALIIEPSATSTTVRWYSAPVGDATLGAARGSFTTTNTLAAFNDTEDNLGRSFYTADSTANASYDEIRFWNGALSQANLERLHAAGPDADLSQLSSAGRLPTGTALQVTGSDSVFDLNGIANGQSLGSLSGIAGSRITNSAPAPVALSVGSDNSSTTFAGSIDGPLALTKTGLGTLTLAGPNTYTGGTSISSGVLAITSPLPAGTALAIASGARLTAANQGLLLRLSSLTLAGAPGAWTATVDLNSNSLIIVGGAGGNIPSQIAQAANLGQWNRIGGITSSSAQLAASTSTATALAYATGTEFTAATGLTTFAGQSFNPTDTLIKYTLAGDANMDGSVTFADFLALQNHYNQPGDWSQGDWNYDGQVTFADFLILQNNYNKTLPSLSPQSTALSPQSSALSTSSAPEPTTLTLLIAECLLVLSSMRRDHRRNRT